MPYALLIGVLIAFTALIPVFGAFIGCVMGCFLIFIDGVCRDVPLSIVTISNTSFRAFCDNLTDGYVNKDFLLSDNNLHFFLSLLE